MNPAQFRRIVWNHYRREGRHDLPWRATRTPYRILVSEVMLQQTQVERVKGYYAAWMKRFPNVKSLADAPLGDVLKAWQGLGYNRRAKMLHDTAKAIKKNGFPKTAEELEKLPGVGHYTARAVMAFTHNSDELFIETNIRTVVTHHFFPDPKPNSKGRNIAMHRSISDKEVMEILAKVHPRGKSREWYYALMDYGAHLKRSGVRLNAKAKGYTKQKAFAGSDRQARGAILKELAKGSAVKSRLAGLLGDDRTEQMELQLAALLREGMVEKRRNLYTLP